MWLPVFRAGKYPQGNYTVKDISDIARNTRRLIRDKVLTPPVKMDHDPERSGVDTDAHAWVQDLRAEGPILYGKFSGWSELAKDKIRTLRRRWFSSEINRKFSLTGEAGGPTIGPVLEGVALLGAIRPQLKGMLDLAEHAASFEEGDEFTPEDADELAAAGIKRDTFSNDGLHYFAEVTEQFNFFEEDTTTMGDNNNNANNAKDTTVEALLARVEKLEKATDAEKARADQAEQKFAEASKKLTETETAARTQRFAEIKQNRAEFSDKLLKERRLPKGKVEEAKAIFEHEAVLENDDLREKISKFMETMPVLADPKLFEELKGDKPEDTTGGPQKFSEGDVVASSKSSNTLHEQATKMVQEKKAANYSEAVHSLLAKK